MVTATGRSGRWRRKPPSARCAARNRLRTSISSPRRRESTTGRRRRRSTSPAPAISPGDEPSPPLSAQRARPRSAGPRHFVGEGPAQRPAMPVRSRPGRVTLMAQPQRRDMSFNDAFKENGEKHADTPAQAEARANATAKVKAKAEAKAAKSAAHRSGKKDEQPAAKATRPKAT